MPETLDNSILLSGRYFTLQELLEIQETVCLFPKLSRFELAKTICENFDWVTPNGQYKVSSCQHLLEKLEGLELINLPTKHEQQRRDKKTIIPGPCTAPALPVEGALTDHEPIILKPAETSFDLKLWNEYIYRYHALGYKRPFGAHQRYFIVSGAGLKLGCLLFAASAWALLPRDKWIGWAEADRSLRLKLIVNNTRFLIFPWVRVKNLASKALSLAAKRIGYDWLKRYGYSPVLLETFVDPEKYRGTSYRAANWIFLGYTAGRGRMDRYKKRLLTRKQIYVYPLHRDFKAILRGESRAVK